MTPNHQQLIGLLARADPGFAAGDFATRFRSASGPEGETGSFRYFPGGFWEVSNDGAGRFLMAPWGTRVELESGLVEEGPGRGTPPRTPPWSLVLPRYSTFLGREDDDWQLDVSRSLVEEPGVLTAALTNLEDPQYKGSLTVSTETFTITSVDLGHMVQTLAIVRTEPNDEDRAVLENIKTSITGGGG
ncbi:hypothetical protein [Arthrobacter globiformis]|uniref:hypothetical protein n=1 Tax=Arthrobacter globiformis TaxID=1665 RepID=UPI00279402AC|nr:hypothetical protein [Arthrobacter globiformis]MDQ0618618.1 hypothetical protein [Arthrobacter globiformis]